MKKLITILFLVTIIEIPCFSKDKLNVLSKENEILYKEIFSLQSKEKISDAQKKEKELTDDILLNEVLLQRYVSKTYRTKGKEISSWLSKYFNMPGADRMYKLSKIKKTSAKSPKLPPIIAGKFSETPQSEVLIEKKYPKDIEKRINLFKKHLKKGHTKNARIILEDSYFRKKMNDGDFGRLAGRLSLMYYTNAEFELSKKWGFIASDTKSENGLWAMGLLYYKEEKYNESQKYFADILNLKHINNARKLEAAFWAGKAADMAGNHRTAKKFWKISAKKPMTFYGALSIAMLGDTPSYEFFEQDLKDSDIELIKSFKYGRKGLALLQIGENGKSEGYLKLLITENASDKLLHAIHAIAINYKLSNLALHVAGVIKERGILEIDNDIVFSAQYPLPYWEPLGGWSIDRALLFAIIKQESYFKRTAKSTAGANGLMQLMPKTAKFVAQRNNIKYSKLDILKPEHNVYLGQQYIVDLLSNQYINNNIIKMLVSYNAGIGRLIKFDKSFKIEDPLLFIESFPALETRNYIKYVMSNLWLYRARLDQPLNTVEDLAKGNWPLYSSEDEYVQKSIDFNKLEI